MPAQTTASPIAENAARPVDRVAQISRLPESLVHDIWRRREYDHLHLETVSGDPVLVLQTGDANTDAGPDFLDARIQIARTEWVGDVEIHRTSSEWLQHRHDRDPRYNRVILHVVLAADLWTGSLRRPDGTPLPEIALSGFLRAPLRRLLVRLYRADDGALPCEASWPRIPESLVRPFLGELAEERFQRRVEQIHGDVATSEDPDQVAYTRIMAALGYSKNHEPMLELADRVPLSKLRQLPDRLDIEALLLGTAGLIPPPTEVDGPPEDVAYVDELRERFEHLRSASDREAMNRTQWRFFRLRPSNFPPIRIAQAAALVSDGLLSKSNVDRHLASIVQESPEPLQSLRESLSVTMSDFWMTHVRLERPVRGGPITLGSGRTHHLILNALLPVAACTHHLGDESTEGLAERIRAIVRSLPPEDDEITRLYGGLRLEHRSAEATQGLHELHGRLCVHKRCLGCQIGRFILAG